MAYQFNPFTGQLDKIIRPSGSSGPVLWAELNGTANASTTVVADTALLSSFVSTKYVIEIRDNTQAEFLFCEMLVFYDGSEIKETVYGKITNGIDVNLDTQINGTDYEFLITNNESISLTYKIAKLIY